MTGGEDIAFAALQRSFLYLPFEHAEDLAMQGETCGDYAHRHHAVIARFGRFPHRNAILGRPGTEEELEFLEQPGSRF